MNENIDLTKILKGCPKGWEFYSSVCGVVQFESIYRNDVIPWIFTTTENGTSMGFTLGGKYSYKLNGECVLFPSKDQRDWSKFTAPWYKKDRFDPKTLKPFDKVLAKDEFDERWCCDFFSDIDESQSQPYNCIGASGTLCIPYNDDTKHLVGTTDEAPEYYRYWED